MAARLFSFGSLLTILAEIKLVTAAIYTNYETRIVEASEEDMRPLDGFVGRPRGNKCVIGFTHL